ncbi:Cytochrome c oxidase assembly protein cox15, partial [Ascosphaera acerosa]
MSSTSSTSSSPLPPKRLPRITTSATALRASLARRFQRASSSNASGAGTSSSSSSSKSWPDVSDKKVGYWLLGSAASVFGIVVFGGLTRLTESGLSITEWRPVTGSIPPLGAADWEAEFAKYRDSPEYHVLNPGMSLAEFKRIYYMEWIHRLWGRVLGLAVLLPAGYFVARRRVSRPMA